MNTNTGLSVMDLESTPNHNLILTASGTKVHAINLNTLEVIKEYSMPSPLTFKEEGGVSLNSDGSKFYTVSLIIISFVNDLKISLFFDRVALIYG